jgi:hypothetical protein
MRMREEELEYGNALLEELEFSVQELANKDYDWEDTILAMTQIHGKMQDRYKMTKQIEILNQAYRMAKVIDYMIVLQKKRNAATM